MSNGRCVWLKLFLLLLFIVEIHVLNATSVDPDQTLRSANVPFMGC